MPSCAVITCRARSQTINAKNGGVSFHTFPKPLDIKNKWIDCTGRLNWSPTKLSTICSQHFVQTDYLVRKSGKNYLKKEAVPSVKIVSVHTNAIKDDFKVPKIQKTREKSRNVYIQESKVEQPPPSKKTKVTDRVRKLKRIIDTKEYFERKYKLNIKRLQTQVRRLKKRLNKVNVERKTMEEKKISSDDDASNLKIADLLLRCKVKNVAGGPTKQKYTPALREFALNLFKISPTAYEYVRNTFDTCLPHSRTLREWRTLTKEKQPMKEINDIPSQNILNERTGDMQDLHVMQASAEIVKPVVMAAPQCQVVLPPYQRQVMLPAQLAPMPVNNNVQIYFLYGDEIIANAHG